MDMSAVTDWVETTDPSQFQDTDAWLAGGTVLFSYGSETITRLLDITSARWPPILEHGAPSGGEQDTAPRDGSTAVQDTPETGGPEVGGGLEIAATCTIAELYEYCRDPEVTATHPGLRLVPAACDCFVASWKIWHTATVGGNVATALPAGPMTSWLAGLGATAKVLGRDGTQYEIPVADLVIGDGRSCLARGELIRSFHVPPRSLRSRTTLRRASLTYRGRSASLVVGVLDPESTTLHLTVTAATAHPVCIAAPATSDPETVAHLVEEAVEATSTGWFADLHGSPDWRRHMTLRFVREITAELTGAAPVQPLEVT